MVPQMLKGQKKVMKNQKRKVREEMRREKVKTEMRREKKSAEKQTRSYIHPRSVSFLKLKMKRNTSVQILLRTVTIISSM